MVNQKVLHVVSFVTGFIGFLNFLSILSILLVQKKVISKETTPVWIFIALTPPITLILIFGFLISSITLAFIFWNFLAMPESQPNNYSNLFYVNCIYIIYCMAHFYILGFVIPKWA